SPRASPAFSWKSTTNRRRPFPTELTPCGSACCQNSCESCGQSTRLAAPPIWAERLGIPARHKLRENMSLQKLAHNGLAPRPAGAGFPAERSALRGGLCALVRNRNGRRRSAGFSLIELLIVIAIILIILAVALPKLTNARKFAQEMAATKAINTIHTAET